MADADSRSSAPRPAPTLILTGLLVGALDIAFAWTFWAVKADVGLGQVFQSVAAGLLGRAARDGGPATVALGAVLHFFIATTIVTVYYLAARRLAGLWRRAWPFGIAYGVAVYLVMTQAVLPLSAAGAGSKHRLWIALSILVHMFWIGLPSALAARRLLRRG
jgi:hypothetical protein